MLLRVDGLSYTMDVEIEEFMGCTHIYIGQPHKRSSACVHLIVYDAPDNYATVNGFYAGKECNTRNDMKPNKDTILMLKGALNYVFTNYPHITHVKLRDSATIAVPSNITARRLLQGRKGWYEEHFGAIPDPTSKKTLLLCVRYGDLIVPGFGKNMVNTEWIIERQLYDVKVEVEESGGGGGAALASMCKRLNNAIKRKVQYMMDDVKIILVKVNMLLRVEGLSFNMELERNDKYGHTDIYIGQPHKRSSACVHLIVYDAPDDYAQLNGFYAGKECNTRNDMKPHKDTILMLKGALNYVFTNYPHITYVSLTDSATVASPSKLFITARRLLQGRKGWYEEHFGAIPDPTSKRTLLLFKKLQSPRTKEKILEYSSVTSQRDWGTSGDIIRYGDLIVPGFGKNMVNTEWIIERQLYDVKVEVEESGGGNEAASAFAKMRKRLNHAINRKVMYEHD